MIGFAIARVVAPVAEIETIAIAGKAQGYGFGSSLLLAMLEELRLAGAEEVELEVRASNEGRYGCMSERDFCEVGRRRGYYREPVEDAVLLRLELLVRDWDGGSCCARTLLGLRIGTEAPTSPSQSRLVLPAYLPNRTGYPQSGAENCAGVILPQF